MIQGSNLAGIDFETYCELSLPEVGLARYVNHPTFIPTLVSIDTDEGATTIEFPSENIREFRSLLKDLRASQFCAHNAGFERAVLKTMGTILPMFDSAVVAAWAGSDRHLAGAAQQLLGIGKLDEDRSLLRLFATKQKDQVSGEFDRSLIEKHPDQWQQFKDYCERDAKLSRLLVRDWADPVWRRFEQEMNYARITEDMNEVGWPIDIDSVAEMQRQYKENLGYLVEDFAKHVDADLNLASHMQLKKWCADRGINSRSFDKQNVERLIRRLTALQNRGPLKPEYMEVLHMLEVKRELGGSSLKKLETILNTAHEGRVYDQYVHAGAAQSMRTTGRSIQMQNLPRLPVVPANMETLKKANVTWSNDKLGANLRQVFRSAHPQGQLIVGDFASIESRALAYIASETWKTAAYARGEDVYKAQAMKIFNLQNINAVTKEQRTTGKVGELSCGYGAGPDAVKDFADKMGVEMSEGEAAKLVSDWRDANPNIVQLWHSLGDGLMQVVKGRDSFSIRLRNDTMVQFITVATPESLVSMAGDVQSVRMVMKKGGFSLFSRVFHGCYLRGRNIGYYKPSSLKGGRPWKKQYIDPKTKRPRFYELYGGKLTGILVQSMCREIFFEVLHNIDVSVKALDNVDLIGQFHDEVVLDWRPSSGGSSHKDAPLAGVITMLERLMSQSATFPTLPMSVEVKHDYRYTK